MSILEGLLLSAAARLCGEGPQTREVVSEQMRLLRANRSPLRQLVADALYAEAGESPADSVLDALGIGES